MGETNVGNVVFIRESSIEIRVRTSDGEHADESRGGYFEHERRSARVRRVRQVDAGVQESGSERGGVFSSGGYRGVFESGG